MLNMLQILLHINYNDESQITTTTKKKLEHSFNRCKVHTYKL